MSAVYELQCAINSLEFTIARSLHELDVLNEIHRVAIRKLYQIKNSSGVSPSVVRDTAKKGIEEIGDLLNSLGREHEEIHADSGTSQV